MRKLPLASMFVLLCPLGAMACLWDYDTLAQERARFPTTLELIVGKFPRHTPEYYEWRIKDRLARLPNEPNNPALYDDIAAACDKLGKPLEAIEWMEKKEAKFPGMYETFANLGTFYFHSGQLSKGIPFIEKALEINPDAHFGRERYQLWLVQHLIEQGRFGPTEPEHNKFTTFVTGKLNGESLTTQQRQAAVTGILGMMRFGKHDSRVLLLALANLLSDDPYGRTDDAKLLAVRAILKVGIDSNDPETMNYFRETARNRIGFAWSYDRSDNHMTLEEIETAFRKELADGQQWYASMRERELQCIRDGKNPDELFDQILQEMNEPVIATDRQPTWMEYPPHRYGLYIGIAVAIVSLIGIAILWRIVRFFRRRGVTS